MFVGSFQSHSAAKGTAVANRDQISHFWARVKFRGKGGRNVWVTSSAYDQSADVLLAGQRSVI